MWSICLITVFLAVMIGVGVWGMRRTKTLNDFFLGGRTIGPWVSALAFGTTYFSAVLFIGFAGKLGWVYGLSSLWIAAGNAFIGSLLAWLVLAPRTRRMTQNLDVMTMPEFLAERYQSRHILKAAAAIIIFVFLTSYSASVFKGLGHLFEANFNISFDVALLIMIAITGVYLIMGGYFAVTLTDAIQGIIMIFGAIAMVAVLTGKAGGLGQAITAINEGCAAHTPPDRQPSMLNLAALVFMTSFGTWGMPQMVQKFYAIRDVRVIRTAAIATTAFAVIIAFSAYFTGAMAHIFTPDPPKDDAGKILFDQIIPNMLTANLPEPLMALILLLVLSASMSTLSSLVLVSASAIAIDLYRGHINPTVSPKGSVTMMRVLSAVFIAISYVIAKFNFAIIVTLMSISWGAIAGSFLAPYLYGLFWRRTTKAGAVAGMVAGLGTALALFFVWPPERATIAACLAMIIPLAVVPLVSLVTPPPDKALIDKAFGS